MNKKFELVVFLVLCAGVLYLLCKNLVCALSISIILVNLLSSLNLVKFREGLGEGRLKFLKDNNPAKKVKSFASGSDAESVEERGTIQGTTGVVRDVVADDKSAAGAGVTFVS